MQHFILCVFVYLLEDKFCETSVLDCLILAFQLVSALREGKKENALKKCEERIAELEDELKEIDAQLSDPANGSNVALLQELSGKRENRILYKKQIC